MLGRKTARTYAHAAVNAAHPIAAEIAVGALRDGGTACDAALAAAAAQTVLEPHLATITGYLGMLYHDATSQSDWYVNGHVTTPLSPLLDFDEKKVETGLGCAVPGWVGGFEAARLRGARLSRRRLIEPAIELARGGFSMHPLLFGVAYGNQDRLGRSEQAREIFMPEGQLVQPGQTVRMERAALTLEQVADAGTEYFYAGDFATSFVNAVREIGGMLTTADLGSYQALVSKPLYGSYRGFQVAAATLPDHGGLRLLEALNLAECLDLEHLRPAHESADTLWHLASISQAVSYAPRFTAGYRPEPIALLTSKEFARSRLELIQSGLRTSAGGDTCSITVVDAEGSVAACQHSCASAAWINSLFCEGVWVAGAGDHFLECMPPPRQRPIGNDGSVIVFRDSQFVLAGGSPSASLNAAVLQNLVNQLDFNIALEESVHLPRFGNGRPKSPIEVGFGLELINQVRRRGLELDVVNVWNPHLGSFAGVTRQGDSLVACGDPRRDAVAGGY